MQSLFPTSPSELSDDDLAELYAYPVDRRWVRANLVTTLDGAAQGADDKSGSLSSEPDKRVFAVLRSLCDVVLVGANTARVEGYQPVLDTEVDQAIRTRLGLAPVPALAVVSRTLDVDDVLLTGGAAPTIIVTAQSAPSDLRAKAAEVGPVIVAGEHDVDLPVALDALVGQGYQRILCEGGPSLMRALVSSGQLDELCLTITPTLTGGDRHRILHGAAVDPAVRLTLRHLLESDGQLFCRYTTT